MVTIKDIAELAGVSKASVSYAFSGSNKVSEKTRQRILKIAEEIDYVPNRNARLLKGEKTMKVGLFMSAFKGFFYMSLVESISRTLTSLGYGLEVHIINYNKKRYINEIVGTNIDAAIIHDWFDNEEDTQRLARIMEEKNTPTVFLTYDKCFKKVSSVTMDNYSSFYNIAKYLCKTGNKRVVYLGSTGNYDERKRFEGFSSAVKNHKIELLERWNYDGGDPSEQAGYQAVISKFPLITEKPDAICCANDELAMGCIKALTLFGYSIPEDISITGFDNLMTSQYFTPKITTAQNPVVKMGRVAAEEAVRLMGAEQYGKIIVIEAEMVEGETVKVRCEN